MRISIRARALGLATALAPVAMVAAPAPGDTAQSRAAGSTDVDPPQTLIVKGPESKTFDRKVRFELDSDEPAAFQCKIDGRRYQACPPRYRTDRLAMGKHLLRTRTIDNAGNVDPTPARLRFKIVPRRVVFGHSVKGMPLRAVRLGDPAARRTALVVGVIHGNERAGLGVIHELRRRFEDVDGVDLWTVKAVNPDGAARDTRQNAHGVDLNRNFSYHWEPAPRSSAEYPGPHPFSEPESRAAARLIKRIRPNLTIWYHQPWGAVLLPCYGKARVEKRYARIADFPKQRCRGEHLPGTATSWQEHEIGGTAFVVELPGSGISAGEARRHALAAATVAARGGG
jgi:murein peptide amidase A